MKLSPSSAGTVQEILLSPHKGAPMMAVERAKAVAGRGLVGDRNFAPETQKGADTNLTLIESEKIDEFTRATGLDFSAMDSRRNIVTRGIELNPLLGREFYVGSTKVKAIELCEPCSKLARKTHRAVLWGLVNKGGLRCRVLTDGEICLGDTVHAAETETLL